MEGDNEECILQAIIIEYEEEESELKNIKARIMLSDGIWAAMAVLHPSIQAKIGKPIKKNDILGVKRCSTKFVRMDSTRSSSLWSHSQ